MIKIVHVISDSNIGGAGKYLLTYLRNCNREMFEVFVVIPTNSKLKPEIEKMNFKIFETDGIAEKSVSFDGIKNLHEIFKKLKPDILHTHACLSARIAARMVGKIKIIYTRHSVFAPSEKLTGGIGKLINKTLGNSLSDGIIAVAAAAKKNVTDTGIKDKKVKVIYNGVDNQKEISEEEKKAVRKKYNIGEDEILVAIIARLTAVKGHKYFIDAAKFVKQSGVKAKFLIAGTGEEEENLKKYCDEQDLNDTVIFAGFVENIFEIENIMDIQANASYGTEAASLSLLEGMSLSKPAVVSDFGGNPEIIKNGINGYVVPQKDAKLLAEKIIEMASKKEDYNAISKKSLELFNSKFTSEIMTKSMEEYYLQVLKGEN